MLSKSCIGAPRNLVGTRQERIVDTRRATIDLQLLVRHVDAPARLVPYHVDQTLVPVLVRPRLLRFTAAAAAAAVFIGAGTAAARIATTVL
jgi:hypothetical protein